MADRNVTRIEFERGAQTLADYARRLNSWAEAPGFAQFARAVEAMRSGEAPGISTIAAHAAGPGPLALEKLFASVVPPGPPALGAEPWAHDRVTRDRCLARLIERQDTRLKR
jgi:hypothetical protein